MGYEIYNQARDSTLAQGRAQRAEAQAMQDRRTRQQAGNALAGGDYGAASTALYQGGDIQGGMAVQGAQRSQQAADTEQTKAAVLSVVTGLRQLPAEARAAQLQAIGPRLAAFGVTPEQLATITPDDLSDNGLDSLMGMLGGQPRGNAPSGYRYKQDGTLEAIPGGPEAPENQRWQVTPYGLIPPAGWQPPQGQGQAEYVDQLPPNVRPRPNQPSPASSAGGGNAESDLIDAVIHVESRGDPNAVSPKGARGRMQVMDYTNADPGFGVTPARNNSQAERERVGRDYLQAMRRRYGSVEQALAAYNAGPGRVDQALARSRATGRDWREFLPAETRDYIPAVMRRAGRS